MLRGLKTLRLPFVETTSLTSGEGSSCSDFYQAQAALVAPELCEATATECQLSPLRFHLGTVVRHHGWPATDQQDRNFAVQRHLPVLAGPLAFSGPVYPAPIPQADGFRLHPSTTSWFCPTTIIIGHSSKPRSRRSKDPGFTKPEFTEFASNFADFPQYSQGFGEKKSFFHALLRII